MFIQDVFFYCGQSCEYKQYLVRKGKTPIKLDLLKKIGTAELSDHLNSIQNQTIH